MVSPSLMDVVTSELTGVIREAMDVLRNQTKQNSRRVLLRRLRQRYDMLTLDDLIAMRQVMGHEDGEDRPCEVCRVIAQEELKRGD